MKPSRSTFSIKLNTEKALLAIDQYEKTKHQSLMMITYTEIQQSVRADVAYRDIMPREVVRAQLLPNSLLYYRLKTCKNIQPKIIIRNFSGGPAQMYISFEKLPRDLDKAPNQFIIKDDVIAKLDSQTVSNSDIIFIIFRSNKNLTMFNFRMDVISEKRKRDYLGRSNASIQANFHPNTDNKMPNLRMKLKSESNLKKLKSHRSLIRLKSVESEDLFANRPENKKKKMEQMRVASIQKKEANRKRLQNAQVFKQKDAEARAICFKCKSLVQQYEQLVVEESKCQLDVLKKTSPLIFMMKFALISGTLANEREQNLQRVFMIKNYTKKFQKKLRVKYRETKQMIPDHKTRELQGLTQHISLSSYSLNPNSIKKATEIILQTFNKCEIGFVINKGMKQASKYRRYVRQLQKKWRSKYQNRLKMLEVYCEEQLRIIFKAFSHLKVVEDVYRQKNAALMICQQYMRDVAGRLKQHREIYGNKMQEIEVYKRLNQQINQHNRVCLKKNTKQLLIIPKTPSYPMHRFFRDLLFLKTIIRGWLEVEHRKWKKMNPNPKINQIPDKKKSPTKRS